MRCEIFILDHKRFTLFPVSFATFIAQHLFYLETQNNNQLLAYSAK